MNQVDVHIAHQSDENLSDWVKCVNSLQPHNINIHNIVGTKGNILETRIRGFGIGNAPYVSFVDPDDVVLGDAFNQCITALENHTQYGMVYTNSYVTQTDSSSRKLYNIDKWTMDWHVNNPLPIHPLVVIRRDVMDQALVDMAHNCDVLEQGKMFPDQIIFAHVVNIASALFLHNVIGYEWFPHPHGAHNTGKPHEKQAVRDYITHMLIGNHKNLNHKY